MGRVRSLFGGFASAATRRRRQYGLLLVLFALVLAIVNVAGWRVYTSMAATLDAELGERLVAIATTAAAAIDASYVEEIARDPESLSAFVVRERFQRLASSLSLANLVLLDTDGRALVDLGGSTSPGETHTLYLLHEDAFAAARSGIATASELMRSFDAHYKNGYAPLVTMDHTVAGVVAVEGGVGFFEPLGEIRRTALLASVASAVAIVFLGVVFFRVLRTEQRLEAAMRRTESLSLMGEMAASVAHEIKNPLGIIRASAERIRRRHGTGEEIFDYIPEEVDRLDAILRAYLDFARGGGEDGPVRCDVEEVVTQTLRLVQRDLEGDGIHVVREIDSGIFVALSASAFQQVLLNLVLNARQAMEERGGTLKLGATRSRDRATISVTDTGAGIAPADRERIFEPFHSGRRTGSGLGLAISRRIIIDAGGRIGVESTPGAGASFTITLPLAAEDA